MLAQPPEGRGWSWCRRTPWDLCRCAIPGWERTSPTLLNCRKRGACWCPRGDLNPHPRKRGLAPQASASAYSATRTSGATLASARPLRVIGRGVSPAAGKRASLGESSGRLDADDGAVGELLEVVGAGVRAGRADARADLVDEVLDARAFGVEEHPRGRDALLVERLAGPVEERCRSTYGWRRRAPRPSRSSPCRGGRRCRRAGRRATRGCRRTRSRSSPGRRRRPARARRRAGGALPRRPRRACRGCGRPRRTRRTALNCGRPTPVIIRVVHIAPGPTPTLMMSAPASTRSCTPSAATTLPATIGTFGLDGAHGGQRLEHPFLVTVCGVDDEAVDPHLEQPLGLAGDVAVDADRRRDSRRPSWSSAGGRSWSAARRCGSGSRRGPRRRRPPARAGAGSRRVRRRPRAAPSCA